MSETETETALAVVEPVPEPNPALAGVNARIQALSAELGMQRANYKFRERYLLTELEKLGNVLQAIA